MCGKLLTMAICLRIRKRTEQFLEEKFVWKVLYQLSVALHVCHSTLQQCQVLHRDIKPANVFLDENNNVKLGDFGLARVLNWDESHSNTIVGTPYLYESGK
uniref:non-specific serine/threonine protein kinase n=1 Tax=Cacopsylla melanoneura TaxID=428564 RepID=A0A8D8Z5F4_9HEMI